MLILDVGWSLISMSLIEQLEERAIEEEQCVFAKLFLGTTITGGSMS